MNYPKEARSHQYQPQPKGLLNLCRSYTTFPSKLSKTSPVKRAVDSNKLS